MCRLGFCLALEMMTEWPKLNATDMDLNFVKRVGFRYHTEVTTGFGGFDLSNALWLLAALAHSLNFYLYASAYRNKVEASIRYPVASMVELCE